MNEPGSINMTEEIPFSEENSLSYEPEEGDIEEEQLDIDLQADESFSTDESPSDESLSIDESPSDDSPSIVKKTLQKGGGRKRKEAKESNNTQLDVFLQTFEVELDLDKKLHSAIDFMEAALGQGNTPNFRNFWEVRRLSLPLFKENISAQLRSQLWSKYIELSKEARRLKDILDEQSAFAVEQIEIAIQALEKDIEDFDAYTKKSLGTEELVFPVALREQRAFYQDLQHQLNLLNTQASRINALRKELLKTEMRVRHKNKFFQRLSAAGDKVFPHRKDLIKQMSDHFIQDVEQFIQGQFADQLARESSLYILREEIKSLQGLAKTLTLNTSAFTQTRMRLSECWDQIKVKEKERKKERAQQRVVFRQNAEAIHQQIQMFKEGIEQGEISLADAPKKLDEITQAMRRTELGREELKALREELQEARKPIQERFKAQEEERQNQEQELVRQKREKYLSLKEQAEKLVNQPELYEAEEIVQERDALASRMQETNLSKNEKIELERILKPLRDIILEKKEQALLALSEDDRQALQHLKDVLKQRKDRRQEVKNQLETLRKGAGSSSLDFEKAMNYQIQIDEEKDRLERANQAIKEIEKKLEELQAKVKSG